jgi:hypothetical protein
MRVHAEADADSEKEPSQLDDVDDRKELRGR